MFIFTNNKEVNYWKLLSVFLSAIFSIYFVLFYFFLSRTYHWVHQNFWFLQFPSFHLEKMDKINTLICNSFSMSKTHQFIGHEVWCLQILNIWPPNSEGHHRPNKSHHHLHNIVWDPIFNKGGETQWGQRKYQTFLCHHLQLTTFEALWWATVRHLYGSRQFLFNGRLSMSAVTQ